MRTLTLLIHSLFVRTLLWGTFVVGLAATASAATLTVFTTDTANNVRDTFFVGETILLKVTGDTQGGVDNAIQGILFYNAAITTTLGLTQGNWLNIHGVDVLADGYAAVLNQTSCCVGTAINQVDTSVVTLVADAVGTSQVTWGGSVLDFFGIYYYAYPGNISVPTGHSFTIVPEPETALLVGLCLLSFAGWRRSRA